MARAPKWTTPIKLFGNEFKPGTKIKLLTKMPLWSEETYGRYGLDQRINRKGSILEIETLRKIPDPDKVRGSYYISFKCTKGFGWCIDDLIIEGIEVLNEELITDTITYSIY